MKDKPFVCVDCSRKFTTAQDFSAHFVREDGSIVIKGCGEPQHKQKATNLPA